MKKFLPLVLVSLAATAMPAVAQAGDGSVASPASVTPKKGQMIVSAEGGRLAPVYRVLDDGSAQIIYHGRMVTIPAASLGMNDGHLTTNLTRQQIAQL